MRRLHFLLNHGVDAVLLEVQHKADLVQKSLKFAFWKRQVYWRGTCCLIVMAAANLHLICSLFLSWKVLAGAALYEGNSLPGSDILNLL